MGGPETRAASPDPPAVRIAGEYLDLLERGGPPDLEEFLSRFDAGDRAAGRRLIEEALRARAILADLRSPAAGGGPPPGPGGADPAPLRVPGFRILEEVGRGGLGIVYAAWDESLRRKVAIKVLRRGTAESIRERILEEARRAAGLKDPAIVTVHSVVEAGECPAIVMEHVDGIPIDRTPDLTFRQKAKLLQAVARALAAAHRDGIIHRDLKPENVLVTPQLEPKVLDFGLAISVAAAGQARGGFEGSPLYASPEQARGEALTPASDVFSLGSLAFRVLTGRPPFEGKTVDEVLEKIATADPPFPRAIAPDVPDDLQAVCLACLARDPGERPGAEEVAADLGRFLAGEPARLRPVLYGDILRGRIAEHLADVRAWCGQGMVSRAEGDRLEAVYRHVLEDEDHWIVDTRKLSVAQAVVYTGTWVAVVAAGLLVWLARDDFAPAARWALPGLVAVLLLASGVRAHLKREVLASASFLAGAILCLVPAAVSILAETEVLAERPPGIGQLLGPPFANAQLLAALLAGLGLSAFAWWRLRLTSFAWTTAVLTVAAYLAFLLTRGWLDQRPEVAALWCLPLAGLEGAALLCERAGRRRWALPFHLFALAGLAASLDAMARKGGTLDLLGLTGDAASPGEKRFLDLRKEPAAFTLNGLAFLALMFATERARSLDLRRGSVLLEVLALVHLVWPLYANARERGTLLDAGIYLAAVLAILVVGPWRNRRRFLLAGLLGVALGSHLLIDLGLVSRPVFVVALGAGGLLAAFGTYRYLAMKGPAGKK